MGGWVGGWVGVVSQTELTCHIKWKVLDGERAKQVRLFLFKMKLHDMDMSKCMSTKFQLHLKTYGMKELAYTRMKRTGI